MKTKYIGIESIMLSKSNLWATIACNIMLENENYSEAIYSHIFCHLIHLRMFMKLAESELAQKVITDLEVKLYSNDYENEYIQVNLPDYLDRMIEWSYPESITLIDTEKDNISVPCYLFDVKELRSRTELTEK